MNGYQISIKSLANGYRLSINIVIRSGAVSGYLKATSS